MGDADGGTRRIRLELRKPALALYTVRPTLVLDGRGQPSQWGLGTWQVSSTTTVRIGVYLFNRLWRFGEATIDLRPEDADALVYVAPVLPFGRGRFVPASGVTPRS